MTKTIPNLINQTAKKLAHTIPKNKVSIFGVDGPTAVGKTIFADSLASILSTEFGIQTYIFRLDWTLIDRKTRVRDVVNIREKSKAFRFEAELHMQMDILLSFLGDVHAFNKSIDKHEDDVKRQSIELTNLYSRDHNGKNCGKESLVLEPGILILVEGHYSLRSDLNFLFDQNILLLGCQKTLLQRKVNRVSGYRGEAEATEYFNLIDLPSFKHHLVRFSQNATMVIDNSDYEKPTVVDQEFVKTWCDKVPKKTEFESRIDFQDATTVHRVFFDESLLAPPIQSVAIKAAFNSIPEFHESLSSAFSKSVEELDEGIDDLIEKFLIQTNAKLAETNCRLEAKSTNSLYNVYFRQFPISITIGVRNIDSFAIIFDFFEDRVDATLVWAGEVISLSISQKLADLNHTSNWIWQRVKRKKRPSDDLPRNKILLFSPTDFILPPFLEDAQIISTTKFGREQETLSISEDLEQLAQGECCLIKRFPLQSEVFFLQQIAQLFGATAITVGNYLIAIKTLNPKINKAAIDFVKGWLPSNFMSPELRNCIGNYDYNVTYERKKLHFEVIESFKCLKPLDTHLFFRHSQNRPDDLIHDLRRALKSENRLLRKRVFQFILRHFGDLKLDAKELWSETSSISRQINLSDLTKFQPSIFAEIYLWLSLRQIPSALLGANVYDINNPSLDVEGHFNASAALKTPIILQASLNALGETFRGSPPGYLRSDIGAEALTTAVVGTARKMFLKSGKMPFLFGIGLDHIDAANDIPRGRAKNFLKRALKTNFISHIVLDGSPLFDSLDKTPQNLNSAYTKVAMYAAELLNGIENDFLIDKEICIGEMNYIGQGKAADVPNADEVALFVNIFQKCLINVNKSAALRRPLLFIGNVGTTHHGEDLGEINSEITESWVHAVKSELFVSAVLHGTTGSSPETLRSSLVGCKKVNVAGDFLHQYLNALPPAFKSKIFQLNEKEPKKAFGYLRNELFNLDYKERNSVCTALEAKSLEILRTINSPHLTKRDVDYFKYVPFNFDDSEVEVIIRSVKKKTLEAQQPKANQTKPTVNLNFCPSLIEVPFGSQFIEIAKEFLSHSIDTFHVDVGDGRFSSREFSGIAKIEKIKSMSINAKANVHLMAYDPLNQICSETSLDYISSYVQAGCDAIAIHEKAFSQQKDFIECINKIKEEKLNPGLVLEVDDNLTAATRDFIKNHSIKWVVMMGVPVGFGGQLFKASVLDKIQQLREFSDDNGLDLQIEIDGGLTFRTIKACYEAGANTFSGWSIVKPKMTTTLSDNIRTLQNTIPLKHSQTNA